MNNEEGYDKHMVESYYDKVNQELQEKDAEIQQLKEQRLKEIAEAWDECLDAVKSYSLEIVDANWDKINCAKSEYLKQFE